MFRIDGPRRARLGCDEADAPVRIALADEAHPSMTQVANPIIYDNQPQRILVGARAAGREGAPEHELMIGGVIAELTSLCV